MWTLGKIAANAATEEGGELCVNLHFSLDTPLASITNREPFEGKLEVISRREGAVCVRKPAYAASVEATVDGAPVSPKANGDYLRFDSVREGSRIILNYPLPERTTSERTMESPYEGKDRGRLQLCTSEGPPGGFRRDPDDLAREHGSGHRLRQRFAPPRTPALSRPHGALSQRGGSGGQGAVRSAGAAVRVVGDVPLKRGSI